MSKYSTTFKTLIDSGLYTQADIEAVFKDYNLLDYLTPEEVQVINTRGTWTKEKLAHKIFNHYYMREIGFETFARFSIEVKEIMEEIMEEKLPLIYSSAIKYDPLVNVDYTEQFSRNVDNSSASTSSTTTNASGIVVDSDTPQGNINKSSILAGNHATTVSANENDARASDNIEGSSNTDETYTKHIKGNSGVSATAQAMVKQYRQNIVAIDKEIIEEIKILFMGLF